MKDLTKLASILLATLVLFTSCASKTLIQSTPPGADIYMNNQRMGTTPYQYSDTKIVGTSTNITLKKDGYQDLHIIMQRNEQADVGAIIGGVFLLVPFLWTMKYDPYRNYELQPNKITKQSDNSEVSKSKMSNSTNELLKLKSLLDQQAITSDDFTALKVKVLNEHYEYDNSIVYQLIELKSLLDAGLLTMDEFNQQKNKLIDEN